MKKRKLWTKPKDWQIQRRGCGVSFRRSTNTWLYSVHQ